MGSGLRENLIRRGGYSFLTAVRNQMCRRILLYSAILIISTFCSLSFYICVPEKAAAQVATSTYNNFLYGISMKYPDYWVNLGSGTSWIASFAAGQSGVFINVYKLPINQANSLRLYVDAAISSQRVAYASYLLAPGWPRSATIAGKYALSAQFTYIGSDGQPWEGWSVWTQSGVNIYSIIYLSPFSSFARYIPDVNLMINSFQLPP